MPVDITKHTSVIDLFCGIGGLTHGFVRDGFAVLAGFDLDESCRYAYEANNDATFEKKDVFDADTVSVLRKLYDRHREPGFTVLVGCAPCQPFSKYTAPKNKKRQLEATNTFPNDIPDSKARDWKLVERFAEIICEVKPHVVSMENVPELEQHDVFRTFLNTLETAGYQIFHRIVDCTKYGVPQTRDRLVLLASRLGPIDLLDETHPNPVTLRQVIGELEKIAAGEACANDPIHRASSLSPLNLRRIRQTPEGGGWKDWPEELRLECHKKESGRSYGSVYGRMRWEQPAPTITTECNGLGSGRFGHPEQDRAISLREAALIQSFPIDYKLVPSGETFKIKILARHVGNAVPVRLGQVIAQSVKRHLEMHKDTLRLPNGSPQ